MKSPFALDGWLEWNRVKYGVTPERLRYTLGDGPLPALDAIIYRDKAGRICLPNRNYYIPLALNVTDTVSPARVQLQWVELAGRLAGEMAKSGLAGSVDLPPAATDARPWRWAGFSVTVKYTYHLDLPYDAAGASQSLRRNIRSALKSGYRVDLTTDLAAVHGCLLETQTRKGFRGQLSLTEMNLARDLLGDEHFRPFVCYSPDGEPVSAAVMLTVKDGWALFWAGGTKAAHLSSGAPQLLKDVAIRDAMAAGAAAFDLAGANVPSVAAAKSGFHPRLVPYYSISGYGLDRLARWVRDWRNFRLTARERST